MNKVQPELATLESLAKAVATVNAEYNETLRLLATIDAYTDGDRWLTVCERSDFLFWKLGRKERRLLEFVKA